MAASVSAVSAVAAAAAAAQNKQTDMSPYGLSDLAKWSCTKKILPKPATITSIHVYDFDNTLFATPLPNKQLWQGPAIGLLQSQDVFSGGGWWHDPEVLAMTGGGIEKEERKGWAGWWNEEVVELVRLSMQQPDVLTVLLTGRAEPAFSDLIQRIVKSRQLDFDLICLKQDPNPSGEPFASTLKYKQGFLSTLIQTYLDADEMRIYEDRPAHITQFRNYFSQLNSRYPLDPMMPIEGQRVKPINTEVIEVSGQDTTLDADAELFRVREMLRRHNEQLHASGVHGRKAQTYSVRKAGAMTAYLISPADSARLLAMAGLGAHGTRDRLARFANAIVISARPSVPDTVMQKVGGLRARRAWRVVALGAYDDKVFAARVEPVPLAASFYVESQVPHVVLAVARGAKTQDAARIQSWNAVPDDQRIEFETYVGVKAALRIESEPLSSAASNNKGGHAGGNNPPQGNARNQNGKRPRPSDQGDPRRLPPQQPRRNNNNNSNPGGKPSGGKQGNKGNKQNKGGGGGQGKQGKGKGVFANYRSLDDLGGAGAGGVGGGGGQPGAQGGEGAGADAGLSY